LTHNLVVLALVVRPPVPGKPYCSLSPLYKHRSPVLIVLPVQLYFGMEWEILAAGKVAGNYNVLVALYIINGILRILTRPGTFLVHSMMQIKEMIEETVPGTFVHPVSLGATETEDRKAGYLGNINDQVS
jgi:Palmitoyl protein thioesterase